MTVSISLYPAAIQKIIEQDIRHIWATPGPAVRIKSPSSKSWYVRIPKAPLMLNIGMYLAYKKHALASRGEWCDASCCLRTFHIVLSPPWSMSLSLASSVVQCQSKSWCTWSCRGYSYQDVCNIFCIISLPSETLGHGRSPSSPPSFLCKLKGALFPMVFRTSVAFVDVIRIQLFLHLDVLRTSSGPTVFANLICSWFAHHEKLVTFKWCEQRLRSAIHMSLHDRTHQPHPTAHSCTWKLN